jgi:hypothetical protein
MAALVMETSGTQEYLFEPEDFLRRIGESYGPEAAAGMATRVRMPSPAPAKEKV